MKEIEIRFRVTTNGRTEIVTKTVMLIPSHYKLVTDKGSRSRDWARTQFPLAEKVSIMDCRDIVPVVDTKPVEVRKVGWIWWVVGGFFRGIFNLWKWIFS